MEEEECPPPTNLPLGTNHPFPCISQYLPSKKYPHKCLLCVQAEVILAIASYYMTVIKKTNNNYVNYYNVSKLIYYSFYLISTPKLFMHSQSSQLVA